MSSSNKNWPVKKLCGRCLSEFIDCRNSKSCCYFRPSYVNCCASNLVSVPPPPPPLHVWISILYTRIQCVRGGGGDMGSGPQRQINTCRKSLCMLIFLMTTFCNAFFESYLSTYSNVPNTVDTIITRCWFWTSSEISLFCNHCWLHKAGRILDLLTVIVANIGTYPGL